MNNLPEKIVLTSRPNFPIGQLVVTTNAFQRLQPTVIEDALRRYIQCDWGDLSRDDFAENQLGLTNGYRLFAAYGQGKERFWIITEADRSVTTVLMPEDY